jgi:hypothetical protein
LNGAALLPYNPAKSTLRRAKVSNVN